MNKDTLGVALTKEACPACTKAMDGAIVMNTRLSVPQAMKVEELHGKVVGWADHFCDECKEYSEKGIILVTIDESKTDDPKNPYRTGGFFVVTEDFVTRLLEHQPEMLKRVLEERLTFIEHDLGVQLGLFNHASS
jgi:hypothetical protein